MRIAVIGWGSLVWCSGCLQIKSKWYADGPELPIEFARISEDGRLTLVIYSGPPEHPTPVQRTYWALSALDEMQASRQNLHLREGKPGMKYIVSVTREGIEEGTIEPNTSNRIRAWLQSRKDVDAAIWTGLDTKWPSWAPGDKFSHENAITYLQRLESEKSQTAATLSRFREYICNTPSQVDTPLRKKLRTMGCEDAKLPTVLFEESQKKPEKQDAQIPAQGEVPQ